MESLSLHQVEQLEHDYILEAYKGEDKADKKTDLGKALQYITFGLLDWVMKAHEDTFEYRVLFRVLHYVNDWILAQPCSDVPQYLEELANTKYDNDYKFIDFMYNWIDWTIHEEQHTWLACVNMLSYLSEVDTKTDNIA